LAPPVRDRPLALSFALPNIVLRKNSLRDFKRARLRTIFKGETKIKDHRSMMKSRRLGLKLLADLLHFVILTLRTKGSLAVENLFLRKQLAFC
jgi:hypothetical protein